MKTVCTIALVLWAIFWPSTPQDKKTGSSETARPIGPLALWQPGMSMMQSIRDECSSKAGGDFGECFASAMRKSGASPQAVAFTRRIDNTGYMRDFRETGRVDVAYVNYPFRANENQGCLLVNGTPALIDVDDWEILKQVNLRLNPDYAKLADQYPDVAIFPGDRSGTGYPQVEQLPDGGQRFIVSYRLLKGCHACEELGSLSVAFDFDRSGNLGSTLAVRATTAKHE
ncbi:MAG: hypothetical protein HY650_10025 [Acidobacteria bacterium]|nr:hypothetical protein [Acidobacteriota bacterium]